jgi:hypothetical protein
MVSNSILTGNRTIPMQGVLLPRTYIVIPEIRTGDPPSMFRTALNRSV